MTFNIDPNVLLAILGIIGFIVFAVTIGLAWWKIEDWRMGRHLAGNAKLKRIEDIGIPATGTHIIDEEYPHLAEDLAPIVNQELDEVDWDRMEREAGR